MKTELIEIENKIKQIKIEMREAESLDELTNLAIRLKGWENNLISLKEKEENLPD